MNSYRIFEKYSKEKDHIITYDEFERYYANISSSIDNDDYFELMIRNAWHISGGEGWSANTTNRRVLVTHEDGTQTVEEIQHDLGLKANDSKEMMKRLQAQGVSAVKLDTRGGVEDKDYSVPASNTNPDGYVNRLRSMRGTSSNYQQEIYQPPIGQGQYDKYDISTGNNRLTTQGPTTSTNMNSTSAGSEVGGRRSKPKSLASHISTSDSPDGNINFNRQGGYATQQPLGGVGRPPQPIAVKPIAGSAESSYRGYGNLQYNQTSPANLQQQLLRPRSSISITSSSSGSIDNTNRKPKTLAETVATSAASQNQGLGGGNPRALVDISRQSQPTSESTGVKLSALEKYQQVNRRGQSAPVSKENMPMTEDEELAAMLDPRRPMTSNGRR